MKESSSSVRNIRWTLKARLFIIVSRNVRSDLMKPPVHVRDPNLSSGESMIGKARQRVPKTVAREGKQPANGWRSLKTIPITSIRMITVTDVAIEARDPVASK